jgi:hypothetical protein
MEQVFSEEPMMIRRAERRCPVDDSQVWLARLVRVMEAASRPEFRKQPCARPTLAALRAQLARPVPLHPPGMTAFSRCN